jgi:integrase
VHPLCRVSCDTSQDIGEPSVRVYRVEGRIDMPNKRPRTWEVELSALRRHVVPLLGTKVTQQLSPEMIRKWQSDVVAGKTAIDERTKARGRAIVTGGQGAATRAMSALSSMLTWAVKRGMIPSNPALKVDKLQQRRRNRFLSEEEARRMFAVMGELLENGHINQTQYDVLFLLALTGARPSEIMGLRWSELDLSRGFAAIPPNRHKTGASGELRVIQFDKTAIDLLRSRPRDTEWVFPDATGLKPLSRVQDAWEKVRDAADLKDAVVYTLRHSFASFAIDQGESLYVVGRAMGHRKAATTERYAHVRDALAQRVVAGVGARLASLAADSDKSEE